MTNLFSKIAALRSLKPPPASQTTDRTCRLCAASMRPGAVKCTDCNAFNGWRRFFPASEVVLSLLIALFAVLSAAEPKVTDWLHRNSKTTVYLVGGEPDALIVHIANEGNQPSMIRAFHVCFVDMPLPEITLNVDDANKVYLIPKDHRFIKLYHSGVPKPLGSAKTDDVSKSIENGTIYLTVDVHESDNEGPKDTTQRVDSMPAKQLSAWVDGILK